jgi:hypothetical protein
MCCGCFLPNYNKSIGQVARSARLWQKVICVTDKTASPPSCYSDVILLCQTSSLVFYNSMTALTPWQHPGHPDGGGTREKLKATGISCKNWRPFLPTTADRARKARKTPRRRQKALTGAFFASREAEDYSRCPRQPPFGLLGQDGFDLLADIRSMRRTPRNCAGPIMAGAIVYRRRLAEFQRLPAFCIAGTGWSASTTIFER